MLVLCVCVCARAAADRAGVRHGRRRRQGGQPGEEPERRRRGVRHDQREAAGRAQAVRLAGGVHRRRGEAAGAQAQGPRLRAGRQPAARRPDRQRGPGQGRTVRRQVRPRPRWRRRCRLPCNPGTVRIPARLLSWARTYVLKTELNLVPRTIIIINYNAALLLILTCVE